MDSIYKALYVEELKSNQFIRSIKDLFIDKLPENDILIKVLFSSLNYKDALSAKGHKGITKNYPHTPGIDASGIVMQSKSDKFKVGDEVFVTGYDLGMNTMGGFGQYISVPANWVVPLPDGVSMHEIMFYGTAGFTAGICIQELQKHDVKPESGKVLVTGATGAVGSLSIAMLAKAGYHVVASTGKLHEMDFLTALGAKEIIHRDQISDQSGRPLLKAEWAGAIDTAGGNTLSTIVKSLKPRSPVCVLGLVDSDKFDLTVYPFLLRGVFLIGIDSAEREMDYRLKLWNRILNEWRVEDYNRFTKDVALDGINDEIDLMLAGGQKGRIMLNLWK
jgi:alcohol dehydrogenase